MGHRRTSRMFGEFSARMLSASPPGPPRCRAQAARCGAGGSRGRVRVVVDPPRPPGERRECQLLAVARELPELRLAAPSAPRRRRPSRSAAGPPRRSRAPPRACGWPGATDHGAALPSPNARVLDEVLVLEVASACWVCRPGPSSAVPSGRSIERAARKAATPSWRGLPSTYRR